MGDIMKESKNIPEIRFEGFEGEWEEVELQQLVDVRSGRDYKNLKNGSIPVYGTGGYMLSVNEALSYNEDAIGIGRKGTIDKPFILLAPFWTVDTLFYAVPINKNRLYFVDCIFQNINWRQKDESTGVPSLSKLAINRITTYTTSYNEQSQIGIFFQKLDKQITLEQQKHDKLVTLKKAMLEKMFPKEGARVPEIRFEGFEGEWEVKKLEDFCTYHTSVLSYNSVNPNGVYELYDAGGVIGYTNENVQENDYITIIKDGSGVGRVRLLPKNTSFIGTMGALKVKNSDIIFLHCCLLRTDFRKHITGATIPHVYFRDYRQDEHLVPSITEQSQIGSYFQNLDKLISLQQQKIDKLKNIKKACLEKMFV